MSEQKCKCSKYLAILVTINTLLLTFMFVQMVNSPSGGGFCPLKKHSYGKICPLSSQKGSGYMKRMADQMPGK